MSDRITPRQGEDGVEIYVRIGEQEMVFPLDVERVIYFLKVLINSLRVTSD